MSNSSEGKTEQHIANILKDNESSWREYKTKIQEMYGKNFSFLKISTGDDYIRFRPRRNIGLNRFYFLFKLGNILPLETWRSFVIQGNLTRFLLHQKAKFIPVFSLTYDKFFTFLYWGEKEAFLKPEFIEKSGMREMLYEVENPSSVEFSIANITWPKHLKTSHTEGEVINELCPLYVYNALSLPDLSPKNYGWFESPFVLVGNKVMEINTFYKSLCKIDSKKFRKLKGDQFEIPLKLIDKNWEVKKIKAKIPADLLEYVISSENSINEVILSKKWRIRKRGNNNLSFTVFPISSENLFGFEASDPFLTICSLLLRQAYLRSGPSLTVSITHKTLKEKVRKLLKQPLLREADLGRISGKMLQQDGGIEVLSNCLGIYEKDNDNFLYSHPAIIECLSNVSSLKRIDREMLKQATILIHELGEKIKSSNMRESANLIMETNEKIRERLGIKASTKKTSKFLVPLSQFYTSILPFSTKN